MNISRVIAQELSIRKEQADAAIRLIDEGNTIPFIARYRKEATGSLNDEQLRTLGERLTYLRNLQERKEAVLSSIEEQGKLTDALRAAIEAAETMVAVEDLYLPYKPKRRTRAGIAKEKGLEPLAGVLLAQASQKSALEEAAAYVHEDENPELSVHTPEEALQGAEDIVAELISDNAELRSYIREVTMSEGTLISQAKAGAEEGGTFAMYYDYEEAVKKMPGYRILAVNRGEAEKVLTVKISAPSDRILRHLEGRILRRGARCHETITQSLIRAIGDAYDRLIAPSIQRDIRNEMTERAQTGAIEVFGKNLKQLLMQPPIAGKVVLGWDPAFRTGCKLAVLDPTGKVLDTVVIYPTAPQNKVEESKKILKGLIRRYHIELISLGNGTASRESEQIIAQLIREMAAEDGTQLQYVIVSEAGASVYSASKLATEEFPQFDVGQRSAASIGRRLQDPLSELVKIDPKAIGVGQYQHDMDQKRLGEALGGVVEDCVNSVGVDLNTASASLLSYISGINKTLAGNIVAYREANGRFNRRADLKKVPRLGEKAYEQCAGFLRIHGGAEPLDDTSVHPESYEAARKLLALLSGTGQGEGSAAAGGAANGTEKGGAALPAKLPDPKGLAEKLGIGEITLRDIYEELKKPSRDPREEMPAPVLKSSVMEMEDLVPGMELMGTVRNIVDFGAFVDIGVHQDGLVHISEMSDRFIRHPMEVVSVGDVVRVRVKSVDVKKKRIALSMKKQAE